jgi:hypothetical protein
MPKVRKLPVYPPNHQLGMVVPKGGSSCKSCEYVRGQKCAEKHYISWKGDAIIPVPVDQWCCDFYEPEKKLVNITFEDAGL